jgi:two-component system sensor histidine kinase KdpD
MMTPLPAFPNGTPVVRPLGTVLMALAISTSAGLILDNHTSLLGQAMLYVLAVVLVAYSQPWLASISCALGAVAAFNFFFVPPRWTFQVESNENIVALATMSVVALVISRLAANLRSETQLAALNAERAGQLQTLATELANATALDEITAIGLKNLNLAFGGPNYLALRVPQGALALEDGTPVAIAEGMACCMKEAAALGPGTGRWPGLDAWYIPIGDHSHRAGAVCILPALAADSAGREHGLAITSLITQAVWRVQLQSSFQTAQLEAQRQQTHSTLLASIAHDLRTPLAAVVGAASALQTQADKLSESERQRLLGSIINEASYLSEVTENTLQLMQLSNPTSTSNHQWESMEEIVGTVLTRVRQRDTTRRIRSKVPSNLPLIKADPVLLGQLLTNLLDNALKYSTDAIELTATASDATLMVTVKDRGPGIPADQLESIFAPYARGDQSGQRGSGLGLAVCRAIAKVHGGTLTARRRSGGGSNFTLSLPVAAAPGAMETL